jgi:quercetin dioxygenase-like cupin family protein
MIVKPADEFESEEVTSYGSTGTQIQWLVQRDDALHFMMRRFTIEAGGQIGVHQHPEEHEIYILEGEVVLTGNEDGEQVARAGDFVYTEPDEPHGYENHGDVPVRFLCVIPKL